MRRTTVLIPGSLRAQIDRYAKKRGLSLGTVVRTALEKTLEGQQQKEMDPFFADRHFAKLGKSHQLSTEHDAFLYEDEP